MLRTNKPSTTISIGRTSICSQRKPLVRQPVTIKHLLRPTIRGPTRCKRNFTTNKPMSPKINFPKFMLQDATFRQHNSLKLNFFTSKLFYSTSKEPVTTDLLADTKLNEIDIVLSNTGLAHFLKKAYLSTGLGCAGFLGTSFILAPLMESPEMIYGSLFAGVIGSFASFYFFDKSKVKYETKTIESFNNKFSTKVAVYDNQKYISSVILCASMGLMISPLVMMAGPVIALQAAGISIAVMGGSSLYAMYCKPGSLLPYKSVAYGALMGLVGVGLTSILVGVFFGTGNMFNILHSIDIYGGIALFTVMTAIDTHKAIDVYKNNEPDHLSCSINMMLNMANIFVRVLAILSKAKRD